MRKLIAKTTTKEDCAKLRWREQRNKECMVCDDRYMCDYANAELNHSQSVKML